MLVPESWCMGDLLPLGDDQNVLVSNAYHGISLSK